MAMKEKETQFRVNENGPLEVTGSFEVYDAKGNLVTSEGPVYLCRCGGSGNKPFCDGTHSRIGFSG